MESWKHSLMKVLSQNNGRSANGGKKAGQRTSEKRKEVLEAGFRRLIADGFRIKDVHSFRESHLMHLVKVWESKGHSPSQLQNEISIFRVFSGWIGKEGMIRGSEVYVSEPERLKRTTVAQEAKTWTDKGVNPLEKIEEVRSSDPHVAIQLELQLAFSLRDQEASMLRPVMADKGTYLTVNWGTKGGRDRVVPIESAAQRDVLERAKLLVNSVSGSTIPSKYNLEQWKKHFYYILEKHAISRKDGVVAHGLRHESANDKYEQLTQMASPVRGGTGHPNPQIEMAARQEVSELLGHSRPHIAGAYIGSTQKRLVRRVFENGSFRDMTDEELREEALRHFDNLNK